MTNWFIISSTCVSSFFIVDQLQNDYTVSTRASYLPPRPLLTDLGSFQHFFSMISNLFKKYDLGEPLVFISNFPVKHKYNALIKESVAGFCHGKLVEQIASESSLKLMRPEFSPLGGPPHPIWTTSRYSISATRSATIHAKILVGTWL